MVAGRLFCCTFVARKISLLNWPRRDSSGLHGADPGVRGKAEAMAANAAKSDHTPSRRRLIELMQRLNFGRIEDLRVLNGEPQFNPPPRAIREHRFARGDGPRPEAARTDFALKAEVIDLFDQLESLGDGVIGRIEVQHGLPFRMTIEEVPA